MKQVAIFWLTISLSGCHSSNLNDKQQQSWFQYYQNDTIKELLKGIVRTDSTKKTCYLIFKSFDKENSLIEDLQYYQCQNNSKAPYLTRKVYDKKGKLIFQEIFNMEGSEILCKKY